MLLRYYWGMGIGHMYAHIKPTSAEESHGALLAAVNRSLHSQPDSHHTSEPASHECLSDSDVGDGWEDFEDLHSDGEPDTEVSSSSDDNLEVLETYIGSDAGSDLIDTDQYF